MFWVVRRECFRPSWLELWSDIRRRAAPAYDLLVEEVSDTSVTFLQVNIKTDLASNRLICVPRWKAASLAMPLSRESSHPAGVLRSWPRAFAKGLMKISTRFRDGQQAVEICRDRLRQYDHQPDAEDLEGFCAEWLLHQGQQGRGRNGSSAAARSFWLVMPWHPVLAAAGLAGRVRAAGRRVQQLLRRVFGCECEVRLSWRLQGKAAQHVLRSAHGPPLPLEDGWG